MVSSKEGVAYVGIVLHMFIVGFSLIFVKWALDVANMLDVLAYRFMFAVIALIILYMVGPVRVPRVGRKDIIPLLLLSLLYPLGFFSLQIAGIGYTTASETGLIFSMMPILTMIFSAILLRNKITVPIFLCVAISTIGMLYILYKDGLTMDMSHTKGNIYILLSMLFAVAYFILGAKISRKYHTVDLTMAMTVVAFIVFVSISLGRHILLGDILNFFKPLTSGRFLLSAIYLGVLASFATAFTSNYALKTLPTTQIALFNNIAPLISVVAGVLILDEHIYTYHIVGGMLILIGVISSVFIKREKNK